MKRLTKRFADGEVQENHDYDVYTLGGWKNSSTHCMEQLADYEDTGLTPEEIRTLHREYIAGCLERNALGERVAMLELAVQEPEKGCATCKMRTTDSYRFYTYPCSECRYRARDSYEREDEGNA